MRRIVALALPLLLASACGPQSHWTLLGVTPDESIAFYYDPSSIHRERGIASIWELADYPEGHRSRSGMSFRSKKEQTRYDCEAATFSLGTVLYFDGNMGSGNVISLDNTSTAWIHAPPDSVWAGKLQIACGAHHSDDRRRDFAPPEPVTAI